MDGRLCEAVETVRREITVRTVVRIAAHVLLFALAVVVFFLGLGVGLAFNATLGTALWIVAGAIFVLDLLWMFGVLGRR